MKNDKILITGASGLIGQRLTDLLLKDGYGIHVLTRAGSTALSKKRGVKSFVWDIGRGYIEKGAFDGVSAIVNLAGAGIAEKRWTAARNEEIVKSRTEGTRLIFDCLSKTKSNVKTLVNASAVGFYGDCGNKILNEKSPAGSGFLAEVCVQWEAEAINFSKIGIREVRCRIGIVLSKNGGALLEIAKSVVAGVAPYFSKEDHYYSWIHIDDVCGIFQHAIENDQMKGPFNTTASEPVLYKDMMAAVVAAQGKKALLVPVPPLFANVALGDMSEVILGSQRCSNNQILNSGYRFNYPDLAGALNAIYN